MDITDQLQQICFLFADNGFVAVLEYMSCPTMPMIEIDGIAGQQTTHKLLQFDATGTEQEVKMVGNEGPGETVGIRFGEQAGKTPHKGFAVGVIAEDIPPFNAPDNDMLQKAGDVESSLAWHDKKVI